MTPLGDLTTAGPLPGMFDALSARLRAAFPPAVFDHAVLPPRVTPAGWTRLLHRTPFVGLGWSGIRPDAASGRVLKATAQWTVVLAVRNSAGVRERLAGDLQGPGQLAVTQVAIVALQGHTLRAPDGEPIGTVSVTGASNLYAEGYEDQAVALVGLDLSCAFVMTPPAGDDFLRLVADWRFSPGDGVIVATDTNTPRDDGP